MRILYVNDALAIWGGLERILIEKANYLAEHYNYEVYIVTSEQGDHNLPYALSSKVKHFDMGINFYHQYRYKGLRRLYKMIRLHKNYRCGLKLLLDEISPDVIIVMRVELLADILKVKGQIPLVLESHACCKCSTFEEYGLLRHLVYLWHLRHASKVDKVVALTESDARDWLSINRSVLTIPNIVNLNTTGRYSACQSPKAIYVGRLAIQKDLYSLLEIWTLVNKRHSDWVLHIYGEGDEEEMLKKSAKNTGSRIVFHRPVSNIHEKYLESSVLLLTSLYEPFGLVIPEAMSCGLPVVAFDCPYGPAEIIKDGIDGYLIKKRDVNKFANCICKLIEDSDLRVQMSKSAVQSSLRFSARSIMPYWRILLENVSRHKSSQ